MNEKSRSRAAASVAALLGAGDRDADGARIPAAKGLFLLAAGISFVASVSLWFLVDREQGLFVGLWVPSILALGGLLMSGNGARR